MKILACIFDLDGVIVDTAKYHFIAWRALAQELGFEFTLEHNERLKGVSRMRSLEILLEVGGLNFSDAEKERMAAKKNTLYLEYIYKMKPDELLPGVTAFIDELRNKGVKVALGSASKNAETILERLKIERLFDAVIDGNKVTKAKPDPEIFLKGAHTLGVKPENCVVFEDAEAGIEAALNAGMKAIGVGSPTILGKAHAVISGFEHFSVEKMINHLNK
jgi:beta-phosphoglucomutase